MPTTQSLDVSETGIDDLGPLQALGATLTELVFEACPYVEDLGPLSGCGSLARLNCSSCADVADVSPLAALHSSLTWLSLSGCERLMDIAPLSVLSSLTHIDISCCDGWVRHDGAVAATAKLLR